MELLNMCILCLHFTVPQFSENSAENVEQRQMDIRDNSFDSFDCK